MGAIDFSINERLLSRLVELLNTEIFSKQARSKARHCGWLASMYRAA